MKHAAIACCFRVLSLPLILVFLSAGMPVMAAEEECPAPRNFVRDARFRSLSDDAADQVWIPRQHGSHELSFQARAEGGELHIEKVGSEPWYILSQQVRAAQLAGRELRFTALLKLDLVDPEPAHGFDYVAGLHLEVRNRNRKRLLLMSAEHEPNSGKSGWVRVRYDLSIPENAGSLVVGFTHYAGGVLSVKNPRLVLIDELRCGK